MIIPNAATNSGTWLAERDLGCGCRAFIIDPDELLGLRGLAALSKSAIGESLQLLPPLVFPAFLLPGLVNWLTGNAAKRAAAEAHNNTSDCHLASGDPDAARDSYRQAHLLCQQPASPDGTHAAALPGPSEPA